MLQEDPSMGCDSVPNEFVVALEGHRHRVGGPLPEHGRVDDVREEERHDAGGKVRFPGI